MCPRIYAHPRPRLRPRPRSPASASAPTLEHTPALTRAHASTLTRAHLFSMTVFLGLFAPVPMVVHTPSVRHLLRTCRADGARCHALEGGGVVVADR